MLNAKELELKRAVISYLIRCAEEATMISTGKKVTGVSFGVTSAYISVVTLAHLYNTSEVRIRKVLKNSTIIQSKTGLNGGYRLMYVPIMLYKKAREILEYNSGTNNPIKWKRIVNLTAYDIYGEDVKDLLIGNKALVQNVDWYDSLFEKMKQEVIKQYDIGVFKAHIKVI